MSITTTCTECKQKMVDGILEHAIGCDGYLLRHMSGTDYIRPPALALSFDTPEEQAEWLRKLKPNSGASSTPEQEVERG